MDVPIVVSENRSDSGGIAEHAIFSRYFHDFFDITPIPSIFFALVATCSPFRRHFPYLEHIYPVQKTFSLSRVDPNCVEADGEIRDNMSSFGRLRVPSTFLGMYHTTARESGGMTLARRESRIDWAKVPGCDLHVGCDLPQSRIRQSQISPFQTGNLLFHDRKFHEMVADPSVMGKGNSSEIYRRLVPLRHLIVLSKSHLILNSPN
jgi:hypothetical protein